MRNLGGSSPPSLAGEASDDEPGVELRVTHDQLAVFASHPDPDSARERGDLVGAEDWLSKMLTPLKSDVWAWVKGGGPVGRLADRPAGRGRGAGGRLAWRVHRDDRWRTPDPKVEPGPWPGIWGTTHAPVAVISDWPELVWRQGLRGCGVPLLLLRKALCLRRPVVRGVLG